MKWINRIRYIDKRNGRNKSKQVKRYMDQNK